MSVPTWVPPEIVAYISENRAIDGTAGADMAVSLRIHEIWTRLAKRPEMETVWRFISALDHQVSLTANGGLLGTVNRRLRQFEANPKLSPKSYQQELLEISKLAEILARKLRKFCKADVVYNNPFPLHSLLSDAQIKRASEMIRPEIQNNTRSSALAHGVLNFYLPSFDEQLEGLATRASAEANEQIHRLKVPRKVNDKNSFRTYFISVIADYFLSAYADYSPTRIAIFCSVALDDANITADLVRKLCPLDQEQKNSLSGKGD